MTAPEKTTPTEVALVCGASPDGATLAVLRQRGETVEAGVLRRAEEGKPITSDLVRLTPREEGSLLFDVETIYEAPVRPSAGATSSASPADASALETRTGPGQVSSESYRRGWDRLFKARAKKNLPS